MASYRASCCEENRSKVDGRCMIHSLLIHSFSLHLQYLKKHILHSTTNHDYVSLYLPNLYLTVQLKLKGVSCASFTPNLFSSCSKGLNRLCNNKRNPKYIQMFDQKKEKRKWSWLGFQIDLIHVYNISKNCQT